jgi:hypothetical protein
MPRKGVELFEHFFYRFINFPSFATLRYYTHPSESFSLSPGPTLWEPICFLDVLQLNFIVVNSFTQ